MNQKRYKFYEDIAKQKGKQLFVEECSVQIAPESIIIYDKTKLVEDTSGNKFEARGILKSVPVARYNEKNANGRKYPEEIGIKIQKEQLCEGDDCYGNHAESEESVFDTVGVWHNYNLKERVGYADLYCIGEGGQLILEKVKAGGRTGFSTVSYGSLKEDNVTVDPDTWENGHCADWVANPSAGVYGTYENLSESTQTQTNILTESTTNIKEDIQKNDNKKIEEEQTRIETMDKFTESVLKHQVSAVIEKAEEKAQDPLKMKEAIKTLRTCKADLAVEATDLHAKLDEAISSMTSRLEEKLSESSKTLKDRETLLEEVSAKYETLEKAHNQLKEDYNTVKALVEKSGNADAKKLTEMVDRLSKDRSLMEADINIFKEEVALRDKDIKCFIEDRKTMLEDIAIFKKTVAKLKEEAGKCAVKTKKKSIKENEDYSDIGSAGDAEVVDMDSDFPTPDEDVFDVDLDSDEVLDAEDGLVDVDALDLDMMDAEPMIEEEDMEDEDDEELTEEEEEGSEEDEKEDAEEEKEKKEESVKKIKVRADVYKHYKEAVKKNPSIKDVNKEILSSKSLYEAVKKIEKYTESKKHKDELVSLKESGHKVNKVTKYVFTR